MKWIISSCLLGNPCRYDAKSKPQDEVCRLAKNLNHTVVCPEVAGGLSTPRIPSEYDGQVVRNAEGTGVDLAYRKGAQHTLFVGADAVCAILKEKSPSCGSEYRYDGTFTETLVEGEGVTAELLYNSNIPVVSETVVKEVLTDCSDGVNVIFCLEDVSDIELLKYHDRLNELMGDDEGIHIFVLGREDKIPMFNRPSVEVCVGHTSKDIVWAPKIDEVRSSHEAKKEYLFSALVGETLEIEHLEAIDEHFKDEVSSKQAETIQASTLRCYARLGVDDGTQEDVLKAMQMCALTLRGILYTA